MTMYSPLVLTQPQEQTLGAIFDTFLGPLTDKEEELQQRIKGKEDIYEVTTAQAHQLAQLSASSLKVTSIVTEFMSHYVPPEKRGDLLRILDLLGTQVGTLLLTGHWRQQFGALTQRSREQVMLQWKNSNVKPLRHLYKTFSSLCLFNAYSQRASPLIKSIGHDGASGDVFFETHPDYDPIEHERIPIMSNIQNNNSFTVDVVVVGSGAGGGVAAAELAKAGYTVLVIEKGRYFHQSEIVQAEEECYKNMYDTGTATLSTNGSIQCLAGSTMGGGTEVNYLVSLKPQHFVREEWAKQGLPYFISSQFNTDLEAVFQRIGASQDNFLDTKTTQKFEQGCRELGYHIEKVHVNTGGKAHYCSRCMMGCKSGIKNSTTNTWLKDALDTGRTKFLDQTRVIRILTSGQKATGVECQLPNQQVIKIRAKRVIVACGALCTPSLLRASGLRNPNIGRHLRLQPILFTFGVYNETIRQSDGQLITRVCNASDNVHGDYYGAKIEEGVTLPGMLATLLPWYGSAQHKSLMLRHKSILSLLNVVRDKDSVGAVKFDSHSYFKLNGSPVYDYSLSKHDEQSMMVSAERAIKILVTSGARELYTSQANVLPFEFREDEESCIDNPRFIKWLEEVRKAGVSAISTPLASVHQLGSCRMGTHPKSSVIQPTGETWEVKNLFIVDGSVFPTAVGVNPMVTIEAISLSISRQIVASLNQNCHL
ncbi:uncharacterized protein BX663DRAFT_502483 [Cokeromyces recurvatus]|uniref:uncharacterized protein n=1 Tax=Cokeromyces recurvatus TaxID=90255 RepID=UPI00221EBF75|nr:uncharacterized protein BX663DRAFT_502483 [Cokeromyces recurvatus]KAI7905336.1 hypothetical protein BX663DRAFT_502483 [Cokeromyces recurvatus]